MESIPARPKKPGRRRRMASRIAASPTMSRPSARRKIIVKLADGKERVIQHMMATSYWSPDGKPISANQMVEKLYGELPRFFKDEEELRRLWSKPDTRKALLQSLAEKGFGAEQLTEIARMISAEKSDVFDVLAYISFALAPITRSERVDARKSNILGRYDPKLQAFLDFVLAQYVRSGCQRARSGQARRPAAAQISFCARCRRTTGRRAGDPQLLHRISAIPVRIGRFWERQSLLGGHFFLDFKSLIM